MKVAVYSGSFDPFHIGHLSVLESILGMGEFGAVYLLVSPQNPLKSPEKSGNARARLDAVRDALARHPELVSGHSTGVLVDDIEFTLPQPSYTIRTLDALKAREPENDFTLVMGADSLCDIRRWKEWERILTDYGVIVYPRKGYDTGELELIDKRYRIRILDAPMVDISSSSIRELQACGTDTSNYTI